MAGTSILIEILALRKSIFWAVAITLLAYSILLFRIRKLHHHGNDTQFENLLVGLHGKSLWMFSIAWMKFSWYVATILIATPAISVQYYILMAFPILLFCFKPCLLMLINEFAGGAVLLGGFWILMKLLNFLLQIRQDLIIQVLYWMLAAFLIVIAAAVLVRETALISGERKYFDENGETE